MKGDVLVSGEAEGRVMRLDAPISFWGGVNPRTAEITLANHPQNGHAIADTILVIPQLVGSSSSSAVMLELLHGGKAPKALILGNRDAILPIGVLVARQMQWPTIPVLALANCPLVTDEYVMISNEGEIKRLEHSS